MNETLETVVKTVAGIAIVGVAVVAVVVWIEYSISVWS